MKQPLTAILLVTLVRESELEGLIWEIKYSSSEIIQVTPAYNSLATTSHVAPLLTRGQGSASYNMTRHLVNNKILRRGGKNTQKTCTKKIFTTLTITIVLSLT